MQITPPRRPLPPDRVAILRELLGQYAAERVARAVGVSRHAVLAAASGREVRTSVADRIDAALRDLAGGR